MPRLFFLKKKKKKFILCGLYLKGCCSFCFVVSNSGISCQKRETVSIHILQALSPLCIAEFCTVFHKIKVTYHSSFASCMQYLHFSRTAALSNREDCFPSCNQVVGQTGASLLCRQAGKVGLLKNRPCRMITL